MGSNPMGTVSPLILCLYVMPIFWTNLSLDSYALPKLTAAAFLAFLASLGKRIPKTPLDGFFIACGVTLLLSTLFSSNPAVSALGHYRIHTFSLIPCCIVAGLFYVSLASEDGADTYENFAKHIVYAAVISSAWALMQLGGLYMPYPLSDGRPYAGFGSTIYLAAFLAIAVPLALERRMFWQAASIVLGIVLTETRAGLIAAAAGSGWWWFSTQRPSWRHVFTIAAGLLLAGSIMVAWRTDLKKADAGRVILYKTALRIFKNNPLFGHGPDTFLQAFLTYRDKSWEAAGFSRSSAQGTVHNDILQSLACGGIFWTLAYLALCIGLGAAFFIFEKHGVLGSGLALFTYAKLNETPFAVKAIFFILAGSALREVISARNDGHWLRVALGIIAAGYAVIFIFDRLLYWGAVLGSNGLFNQAHFVMRVFS